MTKFLSILYFTLLCFCVCTAQTKDTLNLRNPTDFYFKPGDSVQIRLISEISDLQVQFDSKAHWNYDPTTQVISLGTSKSQTYDNVMYITSLPDTLNIIHFYPLLKPEVRKGFGRYPAANILDESAYKEISIDSTSKQQKLSINGRKLVFENEANNKNYKFSYKPGQRNSRFKTIEIGADTLIIKDPIHFPAARLTVKAKVLIIDYVGDLPAINITPLKNSMKIPVEYYKKGEDGADGDTLSVFFDKLILKNDIPRQLFAANGGDGQDAPAGKDGIDYRPLPLANLRVVAHFLEGYECSKSIIVDANVEKNDPRLKGVIQFDYSYWFNDYGGSPLHGGDWEKSCKYFGSNNEYAKVFTKEAIKNATPVAGGKPGEPGKGGCVISNRDISGLVSVKGGTAGLSDVERSSGKITGPKDPYLLQITEVNARVRKKSHKEQSYKVTFTKLEYPASIVIKPLQANLPNSITGKFLLEENKSWLDFDYVKLTVDYANDLFRFGNIEEASALMKYYKDNFFDKSQNIDIASDQLMFEEMQSMVDDNLIKIASNRDYYGNEYGYVPGLNIVANYAVYSEGLKKLANAYAAVLYIEKQLNNDVNQYNVAVDEIEKYLTANLRFEAQFQDIENEDLPLLEKKIDTTHAYLSNISDRIAQLEKDFKRRAKRKIDRAERRAKNNDLLRSVTTLAKIVPVGQPFMGVGASLIENFAIENSNEFGTQITNVLDDYTTIQKSQKSLKTFMGKVDDALTTSPPDLPIYKKLYNNKDTLFKYVEPYLKNTHSAINKLSRNKVSKESVEAEISRMKSKHPEYIKLIDSVQKLTTLNKELLDGLVSLRQKLTDINNNIKTNNETIDNIKVDITTHNVLSSNRRQSLRILNRQIIDDLLYYQYLYAKASEYFTLKQFKGYEKTFFATKNGRFEGYKNYHELAHHILNLYSIDADKATLEEFALLNTDGSSANTTIGLTQRLTQHDVEKLNRGELLTINFFRDIQYNLVRNFMTKYEDFLISGIKIRPVYNASSESQYISDTYASSNLTLLHTGVSRRYRNGVQYDFYNQSKEGKPFYEWSVDKSFITGEIVDQEYDDTYLGLINVLTSNQIKNLEGTIAFDSDFILQKNDLHPNYKNVELDEVRLTFSFIKVPKKNTRTVYIYDGLNSKVPITLKVGEKIMTENGFFYNSFPRNTIVEISVPDSWNNMRFSHWLVNGLQGAEDRVFNFELNHNLYIISPVYKNN